MRGEIVHNPPSHARRRSATEPSAPRGRIHREARGGFTLVELLAVILIIGLITAVAVPVVMQALAKARNAAIKAEIDMLHMAIMNYKNEYGSFPPCAAVIGEDFNNNGTLDSGEDLNGNNRLDTDAATRHLKRIFPRTTHPIIQIQGLLFRNAATNWLNKPPPSSRPTSRFLTGVTQLNPRFALTSWLAGYTDVPTAPILAASYLDYDTPNPTPIIEVSPPRNRKALFDFDRVRISTAGEYHPAGKSQAPYIYIDAPNYGNFPYSGIPNPNPGAEIDAKGSFFNPDTFQIICAGRDETYGTDDDLSNFWPGTRKEYLDSL